MGHFCPPGSGSGSAIWMGIRIQQLKNADPDTDPDTKPWMTGDISRDSGLYPSSSGCIKRSLKLTVESCSIPGPGPLILTFWKYTTGTLHIYHGQPYARVGLNPMPKSTLSPSQRDFGLRWLTLTFERCCILGPPSSAGGSTSSHRPKSFFSNACVCLK